MSTWKWLPRLIGALLLGVIAVSAAACDGRSVDDEAPTAVESTTTLTPDEQRFVSAAATQVAEETRVVERATREASLKTQIARPTNTPVPPPYKLALISHSCSRTMSYISCEGFVKNISAVALTNVVAVLELSDENGVPLGSDDALIGYDPLLPGQESPWKVIARNNPVFTKSSVQFKELSGATILTRDDIPEP